MPGANWIQLQEKLKGLTDTFAEQQRKKQEMQRALQMLILQAQIKQQYDPEAQFRQQIMSLITGGGGLPQGQQPAGMGMGGGIPAMGGQGITPQGIAPQGIGGMRPRLKGINIGGMNLEFLQTPEEIQQGIQTKAQETKATELAKGIPTAETGKAALARESLQNIEDVKNILFPKGTPESYQRGIALASNLPLSSTTTPGWMGGNRIFSPNTGFYNPQTIFRKVSAAISGRQLIQTGVAARPEETAKLVGQFAPSGLMSSKAALEGLNELQKFYESYLNILQTKGLEDADKWAKSQSNLLQPGQQPTSRLNLLKSKYGLD